VGSGPVRLTPALHHGKDQDIRGLDHNRSIEETADFLSGTVRGIKVRQIDRDLISRPIGICPLHHRWEWFGRSCNGENNLMSKEHYIYDFSAGVVIDLDYVCDLESIASDIEEGAMGFNGDELWSNRDARIKSVMGGLNRWVDERFYNAGINILNERMCDFIARMIAEAMIAQRDKTWECFEPTDRAETPVESLAEQG
jgi:hypothetical protein